MIDRAAPEPATHMASLRERFDAHLRSSGLIPEGSAVTIALSGGLDSVVLLELLRSLSVPRGLSLSVAHFNHRMREGSDADAEWVRTLCEEMALRHRIERASRPPQSEAEARELRYEFLNRARIELRADLLTTAHHADDQAETVLFRLLRGTGLSGLAGIPERRGPHIVRPLLRFWRSELEEHACAHGLDHVFDPTNLDLGIARNRIRLDLIPQFERHDSVDFRSRLNRLATLAQGAAQVVDRFTDNAASRLIERASEGRIVVARSRLLAYDKHVRAHLLRALASRVGRRPGRVGTQVALEFISRGSSGRGIDLGGGVVVSREFDRLIFEGPRTEAPVLDVGLVLPEPRSGNGAVRLGGARWRVSWELVAPGKARDDSEHVARFDPKQLRFPLKLRGWLPGDRIQAPAGSRKLKKVFVDRRVGRSERPLYPLLTDRSGVLWIVGLLRGVRAAPQGSGEVFSVFLGREG